MADQKPEAAKPLEQGDIFFFYRPRVDEDHPSSLSDVQRFFMVLRPEHKKLLRLLVVGRKRLPDANRHERIWGFVAMVTTSPAELRKALDEQHYKTRTRGERQEPAARPVGEGRYVIALIGHQMHLAYVLEIPDHPGEVQKAFKITPEASFILSVKNPEQPSPPNQGLGEKAEADYPDQLQKEFHGRRFASEDVRLLDAQGAEFILVGARTDPDNAYNIDLDAKKDEQHPDLLRTLHLSKTRQPIEPLFEGKWA